MQHAESSLLVVGLKRRRMFWLVVSQLNSLWFCMSKTITSESWSTTYKQCHESDENQKRESDLLQGSCNNNDELMCNQLYVIRYYSRWLRKHNCEAVMNLQRITYMKFGFFALPEPGVQKLDRLLNPILIFCRWGTKIQTSPGYESERELIFAHYLTRTEDNWSIVS